MSKYESLPFKVDERSTGAKRLGEFYRAVGHKPDRAHIITAVAKALDPSAYAGKFEVIYKFFRRQRKQPDVKRYPQCMGGEHIREANRVSFRLRTSAGVRKRAGYAVGTPFADLGEGWIGDEHYAFLLHLQDALNADERAWRKYLREEVEPKTEAEKRRKAFDEKASNELEGFEVELPPGANVFRGLDEMRPRIKDPYLAEALALYKTSPRSLPGEQLEAAIRYYIQFYPHMAQSFQSVDNVRFLLERRHPKGMSLDGAVKFEPAVVYLGPEPIKEKSRPIEAGVRGKITLAGLIGLQGAAAEQLGIPVIDVQRDHNMAELHRYWGLGCSWRQFSKSVAVARDVIEQKRKQGTRFSRNESAASRGLKIIGKATGSGGTEMAAVIETFPMRKARDYLSSIFVVSREAGMGD
jgi:hypothetical protein